MAVSTGVAAAVRPPRQYELTYILRPQTTPSDAEKVSNRITEVVGRFDGRLLRVDNWGKRRLAFPMKKHTRGVYVHLSFVAFGDVVAELERNLRILDPVIRFLTVQREAEIDLSQLQVDPDEVTFHHLEVTEDEEDENIEQRLGLAPPPSRSGDDGDESDDDDGDDDRDGGSRSRDRGAAAATPTAKDEGQGEQGSSGSSDDEEKTS